MSRDLLCFLGSCLWAASTLLVDRIQLQLYSHFGLLPPLSLRALSLQRLLGGAHASHGGHHDAHRGREQVEDVLLLRLGSVHHLGPDVNYFVSTDAGTARNRHWQLPCVSPALNGLNGPTKASAC